MAVPPMERVVPPVLRAAEAGQQALRAALLPLRVAAVVREFAIMALRGMFGPAAGREAIRAVVQAGVEALRALQAEPVMFKEQAEAEAEAYVLAPLFATAAAVAVAAVAEALAARAVQAERGQRATLQHLTVLQ